MKNKTERFDLEAITKNISENYKPVNVRLTSYEQEQEDNAIISYEELVNRMNKSKINYDNNYIHDEEDISVRKIEVDKEVDEHKEFVSNKTSRLDMMNYEKEEEFLSILKKLQESLVR